MSNGVFIPEPPQLPAQFPSPAFSPLPPPLPNDRHVRRGQDEYAIALSNLLPSGIAWPRWPDSVLMKVIYGLAGIMGWADGRAADLLERESDPRLTVEMLDSWERAWGLPDPCYPAPTSIAERQKALVLRMTLLGAQSIEFFLWVASYLGYSITITEYRPFMVGIDRCGDNRVIQADGSLSDWPCQIGNPTMRFVWTVHYKSSKLVWFRAGSGQAGIDPHLRIERAGPLECMFSRWAPAHSLVLYDYSGIGDPYAGTDQFYVTLRDNTEVKQRDATNVIDTRPTIILWPQAPTSFYVGSPDFAFPNVIAAMGPPDPQTSNWVNAVIAHGGTVNAPYEAQIDFLIKNLKADGIWPFVDRLWLFGGDPNDTTATRQVAALTDLVATALATNVNNCPHTPGRGFISSTDGINFGYINSNYNPAQHTLGNYKRNAAFIGVWSTDTSGSQAGITDICFANVSPNFNTYIDVNDGKSGITYLAINDAYAAQWTFAFSDPRNYGFWTVNRTTSGNCQAYRNGVLAQYSSNPSAALISSPFTFCGTPAGYYSTLQVQIGCFGGSLSEHLQNLLYTHLRVFLIGIGEDPGTPPAPPR